MSKMEVQKYLEIHGLEKLKQEFSIVVTDYPDRVVLNYSQIESPRFHIICDECRALILRKSDWSVMARSFDRFYNWGEGVEDHALKQNPLMQRVTIDPFSSTIYDGNNKFIPFPLQKALVQEKLDGCCDQDTILITRKGNITIRELCESKQKVEILAYDCKSEAAIWTKVLDFSIKNNNNDWFEIEASDGKTIRLTSNHYVWLPEYKCYRRVKDLKEGDEILVN